MENAKAAPTGCYKCGRPGHWSRDCSFSAPNPNPDPKPNSGNVDSYRSSFKAATGVSKSAGKSSEKPKKVPKTRPKLTPELLVSDDGLGYVLRHFPRNFKYHGRGHEVSDLGNLISMYKDWHSHLIPYYSFDQFVHKVEQVSATRRVKMCIKDLRERVENGGDPTKLHEDPVTHIDLNDEQEAMHSEGLGPDWGNPTPAIGSEGIGHNQGNPTEAISSEGVGHEPEDPFSVNNEDMLRKIYKKATDKPSQTLHPDMGMATATEPSNNSSSTIEMTEDQKARMEANRMKAMERAAARARLRAV